MTVNRAVEKGWEMGDEKDTIPPETAAVSWQIITTTTVPTCRGGVMPWTDDGESCRGEGIGDGG